MAPARDRSARGASLFRRQPVWGDGFAEDDWSALAAVSSWDAVDPDEYLRFFPRLVPRDGTVPEPVRAEVERRLREPHGQVPLDPVLRDAINRRLGRSACCAMGSAAASPFAFWARIHPAYLWPSCAIMHQRASTIGWLGVLASGRAAWMPGEVAEDLLHALSSSGNAASEGEFASYLRLAAEPHHLLAAARTRSDGHPAMVRRRDGLLSRLRRSISLHQAEHSILGALEVAQP